MLHLDCSDRIGERIRLARQLAETFDADLRVMGCHGHSRTREWVPGGATAWILRWVNLPVPVPVPMSH